MKKLIVVLLLLPLMVTGQIHIPNTVTSGTNPPYRISQDSYESEIVGYVVKNNLYMLSLIREIRNIKDTTYKIVFTKKIKKGIFFSYDLLFYGYSLQTLYDQMLYILNNKPGSYITLSKENNRTITLESRMLKRQKHIVIETPERSYKLNERELNKLFGCKCVK